MIDVRKAEAGTVSAGTLRSQDLLESFASELEHHIARNSWTSPDEVALRDTLARVAADARTFLDLDPDANDPDSIDHVDALIDALQTFAPDGHAFGAHEGDGADFGFWPVDDC